MLDPRADAAVRDAVLAHLRESVPSESGGAPERRPTGVFESRSSRYRVADGMVVESSDPGLIGAELVGFLREDGEPRVRWSWERGARAVLVHVGRNNQIVLTSRTRTGSLLWTARPGSPRPRDGSPDSQRNLHEAPLRPSTPPAGATGARSSVPPPLPHTHRVPTMPDDPKPPPPAAQPKISAPRAPSAAKAPPAKRPAPLPPPKRVGPPPLPAALPSVIPPPPPRDRDWDALDERLADGGRPSVPAGPPSVDELAITTPRGSAWTPPPSPTSQPFLLSRRA